MAEVEIEDEFDDFEEDELDIDDLELQLKTDDLIKTIIDDQKEYEKLQEQKHRTRPILSKYEKARILGVRAQQIESGSKPLVDISTGKVDETGKKNNYLMDPIKMAKREIEQKVCPCLVKRPIPGRDPHNPEYEIYSANGFNE